MSDIVNSKDFFEEYEADGSWQELAISESERLIKEHPEFVKKFLDKYLNKEIDWEMFSATERSILLQSLIELKSNFNSDELTAVKALQKADFVRTPPTPEEFFEDPQYLGPIQKSIYPYWKENLLYALNPKNKIYSLLITGGIRVGKCAEKDTLLFTDKGMLTIEELYNTQKEKNMVQAESGVKTVIDYHDEGITKTIKLKTKLGFEFEGRPNHRIRVFDGNIISWKQLEDIKCSDYVIITKEHNFWGKNSMSLELAELFGVIIGDGHIRIKPKTEVQIAFGSRPEDIEYRQHVEKILNNLKIKYSCYEKFYTLKSGIKSTSFYIAIYSKDLVTNWWNMGVQGLANNKKIPKCIREGTKEVVCAFLKGYFDTDGYINKNGGIQVTSCSGRLILEVQQLLLNLGILTSRKFKSNKCLGSWTLSTITKESRILFNNLIGFSHSNKKRRLSISNKRNLTNRIGYLQIIPNATDLMIEIRNKLRGKGIKHCRSPFVAAQKKQNVTIEAVKKIIEKFGRSNIPNILLEITDKNYTIDTIVSSEESKAHCYDLTVEDDPSYISNGFISHNSWSAVIAQLYKLAYLSCLRNIPSYYGLASSTQICFGLFTLSLSKAENALARDFKQIISGSPYFRNIFPLKKKQDFKRVLHSVGEENANYEVVLPSGIGFLLGSRLQHALSMAVISAVLDEVNFRTKRTVKEEDDEDSATSLFNQMYFRITGQFNRLGHVPGLLCVVSSKKSTSDFLENLIATRKNDPHTMILGGSQWDIRPENYSKQRFYVFLGSSKLSSRILTKEEEELYPKDSPQILAVPEDLRTAFSSDLNAALRDLAGIATSGQHLLFEDPAHVTASWNKERLSPFSADIFEIGLKNKNKITDFIRWEELFKDAGFAVIPKHHSNMMRVLHIDLSKSNDITGIAMGGVSCIKDYISKDVENNPRSVALSPEFWIDFVIGLKAPQGDQIDYEKIHQFICFLKDSKFNIRYITFDQYGSVGPIQMLIKSGFTVGNLSVDRTDIPYVMLRDAFINKQLDIYYNKSLEKELISLIHDYSGMKGKVDHPQNSQKDLSDALAGVVANCYSLLTDTKRFPDTANIQLTDSVLKNIFPAMEISGLSPSSELLPNTNELNFINNLIKNKTTNLPNGIFKVG